MHHKKKPPETKFVVVSQEAASQHPYPYIYIEDDGSVRELNPSERLHLETPFLPMDGARPAIKAAYESKNGWGSVRGYLMRSKLPAELHSEKDHQLDPAPDRDQAGEI